MEVAEAKLDVHIWRGVLFRLILEGLFESKNFCEDRDKKAYCISKKNIER